MGFVNLLFPVLFKLFTHMLSSLGEGPRQKIQPCSVQDPGLTEKMTSLFTAGANSSGSR